RHPGTNLATFTSANWEAVVQELGIRYALSDNTLIDDDEDVIEEQAKCFIRWYRGEDPSTAGDPCPNWGTRESPLADMERSGLVVVGPPQALWGDDKYIEFRDDHKERDESVYIQSSEGMLHCFDAGNGEEHWAFIPPQALRWARIAGLRAERQTDEGEPSFWRWSWYGGDPEKSERAVPREILGGPLVVEDVLIGTGDNERYATVLLGCLGYGGYGLYALEITDPEKPRFLWAVENAVAVDPAIGQKNPFLPEDAEEYPIQALLHWVEDGTDSVLPTAAFRYCSIVNGIFNEDTQLYNASNNVSCSDAYFTGRHLNKYGDLAFTLGAPFMGRLRLESGETPRSVGFIGGGLRERLEEGSENRGCVLYVFGLEDGRIYGAWGKGITTEYSPSDLYFGEKVETMGMIYAPISPMVLPGGDRVRRIYAPDSNGYIHCIKFYDDAAGEELAMDKWEHEIPVYLADSSPVAIPYQMPVGTIGNAIWLFGGTKDILTPSGNLTNDNQYIFGIKVSAFCDGVGCGLDCTDESIKMENLKPLSAEEGDEVLVIDSSACGYEDGAEKYWGWKIDLLEEEYVSAPPTLSDIFGRLFVATFVPDDTVDRCVAESGTGKLFVFDAQNGASDWPEGTDEKYVAFNNIRIGGIAVYDSFRTEGDEEEPGTRVILTFEKGKGGAANLEDALKIAGAKDIAVGDEVASFFLGLTESRKSDLGVIHFNETSLRFWKNSQ
ncbi:MAG TPA: PilC/PilY family type IV pilus protein, partial [Synergistaceae bacterium]|nr:PilC/PilY family type IV pilus protein [Synergistaceae bacterium]